MTIVYYLHNIMKIETGMNKAIKPTVKTKLNWQSMCDFFGRAEVKAQIEIQKSNPYGSQAHRAAFNEMVRLASEIGAAKYFGDY